MRCRLLFSLSGDGFSFSGKLVGDCLIRGARCACSLTGWKHSAFILPENHDPDYSILFHSVPFHPCKLSLPCFLKISVEAFSSLPKRVDCEL